MATPYRDALDTLDAVLSRMDDAAVDLACTMIAEADKVVLYGCGREGLQIRGLCMRLFHVGRDVAMVGDMTTPPLGYGDLFVVSAGPGELATAAALANIAKAAGARVLFFTAQRGGELDRLADHTVVIPAQTMASDAGDGADTVLPMGSVYEGAMYVLFEVMVFKLKAMLGISPAAMRLNHTNME